MEIRIGESEYFIKGDKYQYSLAVEKERSDKSKKKGEKYIEEFWFGYRRIADVLHEFVDLRIRESDAKDIVELSRRVDEIHRQIEDHFKREGEI